MITLAPAPRAGAASHDDGVAGLPTEQDLALAQRLVEAQDGSMQPLPDGLKLRLG